MKLEYVDGIGLLTIDHPPVNAVGLEQVEQITELVRGLAPRTPLVLTGAGATFCAGVDTKAFERYDGDNRAQLVYSITRMVAELLEVSEPVVAAVNGHALGGGFVLMLCADYRFAAQDARIRLGLTEAEAGIPFPIGPLEVIRTELSADLLRNLTLTSRTVNPGVALQAAVVDELVDAERLVNSALVCAAKLGAQRAFVAVKHQIRGELAARVRQSATAGKDPLADLLR